MTEGSGCVDWEGGRMVTEKEEGLFTEKCKGVLVEKRRGVD